MGGTSGNENPSSANDENSGKVEHVENVKNIAIKIAHRKRGSSQDSNEKGTKKAKLTSVKKIGKKPARAKKPTKAKKRKGPVKSPKKEKLIGKLKKKGGKAKQKKGKKPQTVGRTMKAH